MKNRHEHFPSNGFPEILECLQTSEVQSLLIRLVPEDYSQSSNLLGFQLVSELLCKTGMPHRTRIFQNWTYDGPALTGVKRVFELNILGVRMSDRMDFTPHINYVTTSAVQSTYALRVLRAHGLSGPNLWDVTRATAVAKLTYACSACWGYVDSGGKARIQSVLNKLRRLGFLAEHISFDQICSERDTKFFSQILINPQHVLHQLLPPC